MKKKYILLLMLILLLISSCASGKNTLSTILDENNTFRYGDSEIQTINISMPNNDIKELDAILFIHGINSGHMEYWTFLDHYKTDYIIGIMNYEHRKRRMIDLLHDVDNAVIFLNNHASENNLKINRLIIMGHSLGGAMGLSYSYMESNDAFEEDNYSAFRRKSQIPIAFLVVLSALSDMADHNIQGNILTRSTIITRVHDVSSLVNRRIWGILSIIFNIGNIDSYLEAVRRISPVNHVSENSPPTIIVHDKNDVIVPHSNSETLHAMLNEKNVPNIFISTEHLGHRLGNSGDTYIKMIDRDLENQLLDAINDYINKYARGRF